MSGDCFKNAKTIAEIYAIAKTLKERGEDPSEVNALVMQKRRELFQNGNDINMLHKVLSNVNMMGATKVSMLLVDSFDPTNSGRIIINADGRMVL